MNTKEWKSVVLPKVYEDKMQKLQAELEKKVFLVQKHTDWLAFWLDDWLAGWLVQFVLFVCTAFFVYYLLVVNIF